MFINKSLLFVIFISVPCTFITLRGWGPLPEDLEESEAFAKKVINERRLVNTIKHMSLVQKIMSKKLGENESLMLSKEIYEHAFGPETSTITWVSPGKMFWSTINLPLFRK